MLQRILKTKTMLFCMLMVRKTVLPNATMSQLIVSFAIALITGQLSKEISVVGKEIEKLFGVLDEDLLKLQ